MTTTIIRVESTEAYDLLYEEHLSMLPVINREAMQRAIMNSSQIWLGTDDGKVLALWGLIPPTILSDVAYLWLHTTRHLTGHTFVLVRHSQRLVQDMLHDYPTIVGHGTVGARRSLRWLRWLGAEFGEPQGQFLPFKIEANKWPQVSAQ